MSQSDEIAARKESLRQRLRTQRAALDRPAAAVAARRLERHLLALPEVARAERVLTCLSFGDEIDTWPLVESLGRAGKELFVPRAWRDDRRLTLHPYPCPLETLGFGLRQPVPDASKLPPEAHDEIDCALVLGLGFDRRGGRLGYGAGYFDRFLAGRHFPMVGLAFEQQLVDQIPTESHDVAMTIVVTDAGVVRP